MLLTIENALNATQLATAARVMAEAPWIDGNATAGHQAMRAKHNVQIPEDHPPAVQLGEAILSALAANPLFVSAALPLKIFPPLFNRYSGGQSFGTHVDNAIRKLPGNPERVRTDLAATLFLVQPEEYDGGELCIESVYGERRVKLPAGHMVLYPADSLHHVTAVTRGTRTCAFFWIQSMIRDTARRSILLDLDLAIQRLSRDHPDHPCTVQLVGVYHNLVRQWAET